MCEGKLKRLVTQSIRKECSMAILPVRCPSCEGTAVVKRGKTERGQQRYLCQTAACSSHTFLIDYTNRGYLPAVKRQIIELAMNGSGIRDTARGLGISTDTVLRELKKKKASSRR
jgi:transposase-like protein